MNWNSFYPLCSSFTVLTEQNLKKNYSHLKQRSQLRSSLPIDPGRPFDLAVFEDILWISDQETQQLWSVHKRTGKKLQLVQGSMVQPASIVVVHPLAKPGTGRKQKLIYTQRHKSTKDNSQYYFKLDRWQFIIGNLLIKVYYLRTYVRASDTRTSNKNIIHHYF